MHGLLITFEGIDYSGKTTQALQLKERLEAAGYEVLYLREPGGTAISEAIRKILLDNRHRQMHRHTELLLYCAARSQIVQEIIKPALERGKIVICDRYADSTTAYQGYGRQIDLNTIRALNALATENLAPDITFLLDLSPEEAARRQQHNGLTRDRLESEQTAFYERVRQGYLQIASEEPDRVVKIAATEAPENLHAQIWQKTAALLSRRQRKPED